jgi:FMN-dependent NADH-azoreductase
MKKVLVINASANTTDSVSRRLSDNLVGYLEKTGYPFQIHYRDLARHIPPHICQAWIEADSKPAAARSKKDQAILKTSDSYINEIHQADLLVLATPMYNWSIPSSLKAYLDQVLRFKETFATNPEDTGKRYLGLLKNKPLFLILSRGSQGYGKGEKNEHMDFQLNYLKMVFNIMGIEQIHELIINGTKRSVEESRQDMEALDQQLKKLIYDTLSL